jgi:hypothetical protein
MIFMTPSSLGHLLGGLGEQGHRAGTSDGPGELSLVAGTAARDAARRDLAPLRDEVPEPADVLVIDQADPIDAKLANFATPEPAPLDWFRSWRNGLFLPLEPDRF